MNDTTQYLVLGLINLLLAVGFASKVEPYRKSEGGWSLNWPSLAIAMLCGGSALMCGVLLLTT